jgi:hypothetical protein
MTCIHHWLLQDKQEGRSPGRCKKCGAERVFVEPLTFEWSLTNRIVPARDFAEAIERRQAMMQEEA